MIDICDETLISVAEAVKKLPRRHTGRPVHLSTVYRWAQRGVRGVRLETIRVGNTICTSMEALQRFFERCTDRSTKPLRVTRRQRGCQIERAERELDEAGI